MGSSTSAQIVKNVVYLGNLPDKIYDSNEGEYRESQGWSIVDPCFPYGRLYADRLTKQSTGETVLLVNTSEDAAGGAEEWVVFADDKKAVRSFLKSFGIKAEITAQDAISQTL